VNDLSIVAYKKNRAGNVPFCYGPLHNGVYGPKTVLLIFLWRWALCSRATKLQALREYHATKQPMQALLSVRHPCPSHNLLSI
jgi:hypothetical protein